MGIFDKFLKVIGFEDENEIVEEEKPKTKKEKKQEIPTAKFDAKANHSFVEETT